jgi:hypothetical protein
LPSASSSMNALHPHTWDRALSQTRIQQPQCLLCSGCLIIAFQFWQSKPFKDKC